MNPMAAPNFQDGCAIAECSSSNSSKDSGALWLWSRICRGTCGLDCLTVPPCEDAPPSTVMVVTGYTGCAVLAPLCATQYLSTLLEHLCPMSCGAGCASNSTGLVNVTAAVIPYSSPGSVLVTLDRPVLPGTVTGTHFTVVVCGSDGTCTPHNVAGVAYADGLPVELSLSLEPVLCGDTVTLTYGDDTRNTSIPVTNNARAGQVDGGLLIGDLISLHQWNQLPTASTNAFKEALKASTSQSGATIQSEQVNLESVAADTSANNALSDLAVRYSVGLLCNQASSDTAPTEVLVSSLAQALSRGLMNSSTFVATFVDAMNRAGIQLNATASTPIFPTSPHGVQLMSLAASTVSVDYVIRTFGSRVIASKGTDKGPEKTR